MKVLPLDDTSHQPRPSQQRLASPALTADPLIENERDPRFAWKHPRPRPKVESELQYLAALLPRLRREDPDRAVRISELASYHLELAAYAHADAVDPASSPNDRGKARKLEEDHHRTIVTLLLLYRHEFPDNTCPRQRLRGLRRGHGVLPRDRVRARGRGRVGPALVRPDAPGDRVLANYYRKFTPGTSFTAFIPDWAR